MKEDKRLLKSYRLYKVMREDIEYLREELRRLRKRVYDIETGDI